MEYKLIDVSRNIIIGYFESIAELKKCCKEHYHNIKGDCTLQALKLDKKTGRYKQVKKFSF